MADCKQDQQSIKGSLTPKTAFPPKSHCITFCNKHNFFFSPSPFLKNYKHWQQVDPTKSKPANIFFPLTNNIPSFTKWNCGTPVFLFPQYNTGILKANKRKEKKSTGKCSSIFSSGRFLFLQCPYFSTTSHTEALQTVLFTPYKPHDCGQGLTGFRVPKSKFLYSQIRWESG